MISKGNVCYLLGGCGRTRTSQWRNRGLLQRNGGQNLLVVSALSLGQCPSLYLQYRRGEYYSTSARVTMSEFLLGLYHTFVFFYQWCVINVIRATIVCRCMHCKNHYKKRISQQNIHFFKIIILLFLTQINVQIYLLDFQDRM